MTDAIFPNSTIGIFGSGQLGRMFAIEAAKLGYRVHAFSPEQNSPTGQICHLETVASYDDLDAVAKFARSVDVITLEFENVPSATIEKAGEFTTVHPNSRALYITQNRRREKNFLSDNGFPVVPYRHVSSLAELTDAASDIGYPSVLKTAGFGYDGKGQVKIAGADQVHAAYDSVNGRESILEAFISYDKEISVVCTRGINGEFAHYGVIENQHVNHILDLSFTPADVSSRVFENSVSIAQRIAELFDYVGTMCVEFFVTGEDLLVNEIAPRPHNSGHLTFGPCAASQFEQQLRAVCGLPLSSTEFFRPAAMANILGDIWENGKPSWSAALADPDVSLHLYGKREPKAGRKMGHLVATADTAKLAVEKVVESRNNLRRSAFTQQTEA